MRLSPLRLALGLVVAVALAPGTWLRSPQPPADHAAPLVVRALEVPQERAGPFDILGLWELDSANEHFGGYSALVALDEDTLLAGSDRGRLLLFSAPGSGPQSAYMEIFPGLGPADKRLVDLEALTRDAASGQLWAAYEGNNGIERIAPDLASVTRVRPEEMRNWPRNSGPEALARLPDGRFAVLAEGRREWRGGGYPAVLFDRDPVSGAKAIAFRFEPPEGYRPVDMAALPDGRVLILVRQAHLALPPRFTTRILLADPKDIRANGTWRGVVLARFEDPLPTDNFEGLAVSAVSRERITLWMIADDNRGMFQRTLLYKLALDPARLPETGAGKVKQR